MRREDYSCNITLEETVRYTRVSGSLLEMRFVVERGERLECRSDEYD